MFLPPFNLQLLRIASISSAKRIVKDMAEPLGVISLMQMMQPGRIVNTLSKL